MRTRCSTRRSKTRAATQTTTGMRACRRIGVPQSRMPFEQERSRIENRREADDAAPDRARTCCQEPNRHADGPRRPNGPSRRDEDAEELQKSQQAQLISGTSWLRAPDSRLRQPATNDVAHSRNEPVQLQDSPRSDKTTLRGQKTACAAAR